MPKSKIPYTLRMVEMAAMGYVIWNLCSRGFDCTEIDRNYNGADIWVKIDGKVVSVEVKGSSTPIWRARRQQIISCDIIIFVDIGEGCWIMTSEEALANLKAQKPFAPKEEGMFFVDAKKFPDGCRGAWRKIGEFIEVSPPKPKGPPPPVVNKWKTIRKRLANGTIKEYRYISRPKRREETARNFENENY